MTEVNEMTAITSTRLIFDRTLRQAKRNPGVAYGQPILIALCIGIVNAAMFGRMDELPDFPAPSYFDWITPGVLFLSAVVGAGFGAAELLRDARTGYLDRIRLSPSSPTSLLAGRMAFELVRGLVAAAVVLGVALAFGAENHSGIAGYLALVALTGGLAFAWNGVFFLSAIKTLNPAAVLGLQPLFFPVLLLSSWFAPRPFMPGWYAMIARFNPISAFLDGQRSILAGDTDWGLVAIAASFIVALGVVTFRLAANAYEALAKAD